MSDASMAIHNPFTNRSLWACLLGNIRLEVPQILLNSEQPLRSWER